MLLSGGPVQISEIMYHAASQDVRDEWLELHNTGSAAVDLTGWTFDKGIDFSFGSAVLAAGQRLVVAHDIARFAAQHPGAANVVGGWTKALGNNGDTIRLKDAGGATQDEVTYGTEGDWALRRRGPNDFGHQGWIWTTPADGGGASIELVNPALGNDSGQNWLASTASGGTPGAANSVASSDAAPLILDLKQVPLVPRSSDSVTIQADIRDEAAGAAAAIHWRVDGAGGFTAAAMFDDGLHGDGGAGDGVFAASLPAQPDNTVVEYYLSAVDAAGRARTWPAPTDASGGQGANLLYQVDNAPLYTGGQPVFKLIMTAAERAELASIGAPNSPARDSNAQMNATFIAADGGGTEVRFLGGLRNRGGGSRDVQPNNYRLNIPNDRPWRGVRALNLNGQYSMEEVTGSAVIRAAGVEGQNVIPVQVRVNNSNPASTTQFDMFGSYAYAEVENGDLASEHFAPDGGGNYYRAVDGLHRATLAYLGSNPASYYNYYPKQTNSEANDYSDLIALTAAFDAAQTPASAFPAAIAAKIDVAQWLRYFAAGSLLGNRETSLSSGYGDDYSLYRGAADTRFQIINHDLDTILGRGDTGPIISESIFVAASVPAVSRLLKDPAFAPLYYATLKDLATHSFAPANLAATLDNALGGYVPASAVDVMKAFNAARVANVLSQIPTGVTAGSSLPTQNGYFRTTSATTSALNGTADAIKTRSVLVNGRPAAWSAWQATWTAPSINLNPGVNKVLVQALDAGGAEVARTTIDVCRDTGATTNVGGSLPAGVTRWLPSGGPYRVTSSLTVPAGGTLLIDPGTTVFFDAGVSLTVSGRLLAQGTELARIRLARTPSAVSDWAGIRFTYPTALPTGQRQDNRIAFADIDRGGAGADSINMTRGNLFIDHVVWSNTGKQHLDLTDSSLILSNSVLPDIPNDELVHYLGFPTDGYARVEGNTFGSTTGYNDIIDFTGGQRPGPIAQFLNNTFNGGPDDGIDLDGTDAHVEGNVFMHFHQDSPRESKSHAVSTGTENGDTSDITVVRNFFYDVDHAIIIKDGAYGTIVNNTIVDVHKNIADATTAAINLYEPRSGQYPGAGVYLSGNIFQNISRLFENPVTAGYTTTIALDQNDFPAVGGEPDWKTYGVGNTNADPHLVNPTSPTDLPTDFALRPGSGPAVGTGFNGRDMGADVPAGASIAGEPVGATWRNSATLTIGGPDIYAYKFRVNGGAYSSEIAVSNPGTPSVSIPPIQLAGLPAGTYTVYVVARNSAGEWQADADATASRTWVVNPSAASLRINEVLADGGTAPDQIELYNHSASAIDVSGMSLSDNASSPRKFTFPAGTTIASEGFLFVYANNPDGSPGLHAGFGLDKDGEAVYLYDRTSAGGALVDSVEFGSQLTGLSIARDADGLWRLATPTFGAANAVLPGGDPARTRINEWLTDGFAPNNDDFIELYNPDSLAVDIGGFSLTDHPTSWPDRSPIRPLTFIGGGGYLTFTADGADKGGHVNFHLSREQGSIGLFDSAGNAVDIVVYASQQSGVSQGRSPDGDLRYGFFSEPNPSQTNPAPAITTETINYNLIGVTDVWKYNQSGDQGTAWRTTAFNDAGWSSGGGLLYVESAALPAPKTTPLALGKSTYYFRKHFTLDADPSSLTTFQLQTVLDDGAVVYLNGQEVLRVGMPTGTVSYSTLATRSVSDATFEGPYALPTTALVRGDNVIAVEVHQQSNSSSDVVWGATLGATAVIQIALPRVVSATINDGAAQRSMVTSIRVDFDQAVALGANAFILTQRGGGAVGVVAATSDDRSFVLTFTGADIIGGSLADGVYDLRVAAGQVHAGSASGPAMPADYAAPAFHRLFSDSDGDGDSDNIDLFQMRGTYGKSILDAGYKASFDYQSDGKVDNADVFQVRSRRSKVYRGY